MGYLIHALKALGLGAAVGLLSAALGYVLFHQLYFEISWTGGAAMSLLFVWLEPLPKR